MSTALAAAPIDATTQVVTPENIAVHYRVAGPVRRALSFLIDFALYVLVMAVGTFAIAMTGIAFGPLTEAALALFSFLMYWFYFGAQEWIFRGRTLGKLALGLRVITIDGQPINGL